MTGLQPGVFGKLPAHGDFVHRGWADPLIAGLDTWLSDALQAARCQRDDEAFAAMMTAAPLWYGFLPAGWVAPAAFGIAIAPSVDRVGRYYFLVAGVAGSPEAVWTVACRRPEFLAATETLIYEALAGRLDADAIQQALSAETLSLVDEPTLPLLLVMPREALFWTNASLAGGPVARRAEVANAEALSRLLLPEVA